MLQHICLSIRYFIVLWLEFWEMFDLDVGMATDYKQPFPPSHCDKIISRIE